MNANRHGMFLMTLFAALWAMVEALAAQLGGAFSLYQVVWTRYATHLLLVIALWALRRHHAPWKTQRPVFHLCRSLLMLVMPATWIIAMQRGVDAGTMLSIFWLSPLLIVCIAWLALKERPSAPTWIATLIATAGALLITQPEGFGHPTLLVLPVGMALSFSVYVVMTRSLRFEFTSTNLFYTALGVFVVLTPAMPQVWVSPQPRDLLILMGVGALGLVGLYAVDRASAAAPVSQSATFSFLQLAFVAFIAWVTQGHQPGRRTILGVMAVAGAAAYLWSRAPRLQAGATT